MGDRLFGRSCILIANAGEEARRFSGITPSARSDALTRVLQTSQDSFRIAFNVEATSESNANTATISIYNLNESSRSLFQKEGLRVILMAGYGPKPEIIFTGEVDGDRTKTVKSGVDIITTVESGDGRFALKNTVLNKTFAPGISLERVIEDIQEQMGLGGEFRGIEPESFSQGLSISGSPKEVLDDLTQKQDLEWSIQDGVLEIRPRGLPVIDERVVISPDTGLINIPERTNEGVEIQTLLNSKLRPGRRIKIESRFLKGTTDFLVRRVQHQGDNFSGPWTSFVEAVEPGRRRSFQ